MMLDPITLKELIREMERCAKGPTGFLTVREFSEAAHVAEATIRRTLRQLASQGRLQVGQKRILALDGHFYPSPAYRIRTKEKSK